MGAWGAGSFENDTASDWAYDLTDAADATPIIEAFAAVIECEEYLDADEASQAVAAAEVVAALCGRPSSALPDEVVAWVQAHTGALTPELPALAASALERITADSELKELWEEAGPDEWYGAIADLKRRLQA